ncbi:hypothetical protein [Bovine papular stomatitis virus]
MEEKRDPGGGGFRRFGASRQAFRRGKKFGNPAGSTEPYVHPSRKTVTFATTETRHPPDAPGRHAPPDARAADPPAAPSPPRGAPPRQAPVSGPASAGVGFLEKRICDNVTAFTPVVVSVAEEEAGCWIELSAMVRCRKAVGFPVCRRAPQIADTGAVAVCFESFGSLSTTQMRASERPCSISDAVVFQIVAIMYHLFQRGIFLDDVCVDVVTVPACTLTFSVSQLVFQVNTSSLVVLSPRSRLYRASLPQSCYMDIVRLLMPPASRFACDSCSYFFEWIIRNHLDLLSKHFVDMFRTHRRTVSGVPLNRRAEPGALVWVTTSDAVVLGVTLTEVSISDNVRVIWSSDGAVFEVDDFPVHDVFPAQELVSRVRAMVCL